MNIAVIGAGYGDEGKGKVVSYLCHSLHGKDVTVVRFSGGQQAGHKVVLKNGLSHIFSNFGSGTFHNSNTYWSPLCTIDPVGVINELRILRSNNKKLLCPKLIVHPETPVTTPFEKLCNMTDVNNLEHGTCGVGVGKTWAREEELHYKLHFKDLWFEDIFNSKLNLIEKHFGDLNIKLHIDLLNFKEACKNIVTNSFAMCDWNNMLNITHKTDHWIYEGSQGLMLDKDYGFYPHVTRSNTGLKGLDALNYKYDNVIYVTRAYSTRHGNGPFPGEEFLVKLNVDCQKEIDFYKDAISGKFRIAPLNIDSLLYALLSETIPNDCKSYLVINCLDQMKNYCAIYRGELRFFKDENDFLNFIAISLPITNSNIFVSRTDVSDDICSIENYLSSSKSSKKNSLFDVITSSEMKK